jgi:general nucleoside transport system ATP-binding protein
LRADLPIDIVAAGAAPTRATLVHAPLLALEGVTKRFGRLTALDNVTVSFAAGEVHCLLGENGAGKSTLCNLVFGIHRPDAGQILLDGEPHAPASPADALASDIAMVHQHFSLVPTLSVLDNLLLGRARGFTLRRRDEERRILALARQYGLPLELRRITSALSVGERQRVEILKCLLSEPRLLVLDEPTAVLPPDEVDALLATIRRIADDGRGIILVTHKLAEIERIADRVTVLRGGKVAASSTMRDTSMSELVRAMVGREMGALNAALAASIGLDERSIERTSEVSTVGGPSLTPHNPDDDALLIDGLTVHDRLTGTARLDNFTLIVPKGEIVGLAGVEGNGQAELGLVLAGLLNPSSGRFFVAGQDMTGAAPAALTAAGVGVVPEDRHAVGCVTAMTVAENLFLGRLDAFTNRCGALDLARMSASAEQLMRRFDVRGGAASLPMASLSGGNQQKTVLAREMSLDPLVFMLAAQPTRGLDVGAVEAVYTQLRAAARDRGAGVLLISSELDELLAVADRIAVLYRGRIAGELLRRDFHRETLGALMSGHQPS